MGPLKIFGDGATVFCSGDHWGQLLDSPIITSSRQRGYHIILRSGSTPAFMLLLLINSFNEFCPCFFFFFSCYHHYCCRHTVPSFVPSLTGFRRLWWQAAVQCRAHFRAPFHQGSSSKSQRRPPTAYHFVHLLSSHTFFFFAGAPHTVWQEEHRRRRRKVSPRIILIIC